MLPGNPLIGLPHRMRSARTGMLLLSLWFLGQVAIVGHQFSHAHSSNPATRTIRDLAGSTSAKIVLSRVACPAQLLPASLHSVLPGGHQGSPVPQQAKSVKDCEFCQLLTQLSPSLPAGTTVALLLTHLRAPVLAVSQQTPKSPVRIARRGRAPPFAAA